MEDTSDTDLRADAVRGDRLEEAAYADSWAAAPPAAAAALGLVSARVGPYRVVGCAALGGVPMLNRVLGADALDEPDTEALDAALALLAGRGCAAQVAARPGVPAEGPLRAWAAGHGFAEGYAWMRFVHPGAPVPEGTGVRVRECGPADAALVGATFARGYGLPPAFAEVVGALAGRDGWSCHLAVAADGTALGTGSRYSDGAGAWLGLGATLPEHRGRGAQGAVLASRVAEALAAGRAPITTETGVLAPGLPAASYRNILRAGFAEAGARTNLVRAAPDRPT